MSVEVVGAKMFECPRYHCVCLQWEKMWSLAWMKE